MAAESIQRERNTFQIPLGDHRIPKWAEFPNLYPCHYTQQLSEGKLNQLHGCLHWSLLAASKNRCKSVKRPYLSIASFAAWCLNNDFPPRAQGCPQSTGFLSPISENHIGRFSMVPPPSTHTRPAGLFIASSWSLLHVWFGLWVVLVCCWWFFFPCGSFFFPSSL